MKKLIMVAAILAVVVVAAVPAIAEDVVSFGGDAPVGSFSGDAPVGSFSGDDPDDPPVSQEFSERRITSGAASPSERISNTGNNVSLCPTDQQIVNTGNVANEQGVTQYFTDTDDIDFSGSSITIEPSATGGCTDTTGQAAAAG